MRTDAETYDGEPGQLPRAADTAKAFPIPVKVSVERLGKNIWIRRCYS